VLAQHAQHQLAIAGVADHECSGRDCFSKPARQIVERDDLLAGRAQLAHNVAADVSGTARNQHCCTTHGCNR
jgi:hypothetical protein